jgi:protein O-mannosyl-transferase
LLDSLVEDRSTEVASQAQPTPATKKRIYIGLLASAVVLVYSNTLWNAFTMDDRQLYIVKNPVVTHPSLRAFFTPHVITKVFRPLTFASFALDWKVGAGHPFIFHLVNLLLHVAATVLLFLLLRVLLQSLVRGGSLAFAAALLFAVHPIHTEAVTSIVGRAELLAAALLFAAWIFHLKDREIPALLCLTLALLSKESAIVFLPLVLIGDYIHGQWKSRLRYLRIAAVSLVYLAVLWTAEGGHFGRVDIPLLDNPLGSLTAPWRVLNALRVAWKYIGLQLYPATLSCDYSFNQIRTYLDWRHTWPAASAAFAVFCAWIVAVWKRQRALALAGTIYFVGFAVTANILTPIGTVMGERLAYLPSAGFCLLIALAWNWTYKRQQKLALGVLALVVVALGARTVVRNHDWKDNLTLWSADVRAAPDSAKMHVMLGSAYVDSGQFEPALKEMELALKIYPDFPEALEASGLLQSWKGNYQAAGAMMERAYYMVSRGYPNYDDMAVNLAGVYVQTNHIDGALQVLNREIAENPGYARAWANRAVIHYKLGDSASARTDASTALHLDPLNQQARNLMQLLNGSAQPVRADK